MPSSPFIGVRSSCDMLARNSLLAWLAASAACIAFSSSPVRCRMRCSKQFLMLADFLLRGRQRLDHPVEALAQIFDFVAGAAHLDGLESAFANRCDTGLQERQRPGQKPHGEPGNRERHHAHHAEQHDSLGQVEGVLDHIQAENGPNYPQHQHRGEDRELRRQRAVVLGEGCSTYPWCDDLPDATIGRTP